MGVENLSYKPERVDPEALARSKEALGAMSKTSLSEGEMIECWNEGYADYLEQRNAGGFDSPQKQTRPRI